MNSSKCLMISNCLFDTFLEVCPDTRILSLCYICDMEKFCAYVKYLIVITLGQNLKFSILAWKYDTGQKLLENILSNQKTITKWHTLQYQKRHSKKQFSVCVVGLGKIRSYQLYVCQSFFFTSSQWKNTLFKMLEMRKKWFEFDKNLQIIKLKVKLTSTKLILPNFDDIFFLWKTNT